MKTAPKTLTTTRTTTRTTPKTKSKTGASKASKASTSPTTAPPGTSSSPRAIISPGDMIVFAAVVAAGGFTRAARQLGLSKQTVSERVAKLEQQLGVRLLERTTRQVRVTDAGAVYAERCAAIAAQVDEANHEVQERQQEPIGLLRISAPVLYGRRFLGPVVAAFLKQHPRLRVEIVLADRRVDLIEEGLDLAVRVGGLKDSSLTARKLDEGRVFYVASPRFLKEHACTPAALKTTPCIGTRAAETWLVDGVQTKIEPVLLVNDLEMACDAAAAGLGLARLPSLVCGDALRAGKLRVAFAEPARSAVYAVYPSRQHLPAKVKLFVDALVALGKRMPIDANAD